ncbi:MAG: hypothetical protein P4L86_01990, partial [Mycobacterium sp.]|nr:hypothetical protein [Mycobacterium sp.]
MRLSGARNSSAQRGAVAPTTMDGGTTVVPTIQRRAAAFMAALILIASVGFVVSRSAKPAGADTGFTSGQLFASVGGSQVYTYDPNTGLYLSALTDSSNDVANANPDYYSSGFLTVGSAFDSNKSTNGNTDFYVTDDDTLGDSNSQVSEFSPDGTQIHTFPGLANPISIAFDGNGDMFVGQQLTAKIAEFAPTPGTAADATAPADWTRLPDIGTAPADPIQIETSGGPDSIDMSSDQHTIYYTSEGTEVFTYDISTGQQGPIFNKTPLPLSQEVTDSTGTHTVPTNAYAVKILGTPGYIGDVLVADAADVVLFDPNGNVIRTYPCSSLGDGCDYKLFSVSVDPSGTSFWTGDQNTGNIYQVDIATGTVLNTIDGIKAGTSGNLFGLSIDNQLEVANNTVAPPPTPEVSPPTVSGTLVTGVPTQVSAVVTDTSGTPIATGSVTFTLENAESCTATPDNSGLAMCAITPGEPSGSSYTLVAQYTSSSGGSSGSTTSVTAANEGSFPVTADQTSVTYTGPTTAVNGQTFSPSATVIDTTTNTPVLSGTVVYTVGSGPTAQTFSCTINTPPCTSPPISQTTSDVSVTASYGGSPYNMPTQTPPVPGFTVTEPTTLTVAAGQSDFADTTTVSATLTDALPTNPTNPIANEPVTFALSDGTTPCPQAMTDANGVAYCQITPSEKAGTYLLSANFGGDSNPPLPNPPLQLMSSSGSANFVVNPEETAITYTGPSIAVNGTPFTMSANLTRGVGPGLPAETDTVPLGSRTVLLTLGPVGNQQSCTGTTDSAGNASCTITPVGQLPGTIPVLASFAGDQYYSPVSNGSTVNLPEGTQLTINSTTPPLVYNTPSTVSATLVNTYNNNAPVSGEQVTFELNNDTTQTCTATTNASGVASCTVIPNEPAGSYSVSASFSGDSGLMPQLLPTASSSTISVTPAPTTLSYTGTASVTNGQSATLSGVVTQTSSGTDVSGQTVTFTLGSGSSLQSCTATTIASGAASCTIPSVNQQSPGSAGISASSSSGQEYGSSTVASSAMVYSPTTLTVTAGQTDFADATTVQATLTTTVSPKPIANEQVTFKLSDNTVPCPAAMTNASGVASCSITPSEMAG